MATMISEVYEAFRVVGVPEGKARKAAEALSAESLATKGDIQSLKEQTKPDIARLETKITLLQWMVGLVIVVEILPLLKTLF